MKNIILLFVFSLVVQKSSIAQGEGSIWYFSNASGVNFNQSCDIADLSSVMNGVEGTVTMSDEDGNLLFYTNGGRLSNNPNVTGAIWNKDHEVMYDMGTNEGGGASARQSSLAIPKPGEPNHYYLFTMDENEASFSAGFRGFSYFEIDMDLNGGLGEVVDYQESISSFAFGNEGMAGVIRPDGNSYWIVIIGQDGFEYYLVDENGINLDHTQAIPGILSVSPFTFSPNGAYVSFGSNVAEFDTETGLYSNETELFTLGISPVGSAFSPNSRYFFTSQLFGNTISRLDMEAGDIQGSLIEIPTNLSATSQSGHLLPAPDGNLYFVHTDPVESPDQLSFSGILCPNSETPCFKENIYIFPYNANSLSPGLPSFTDHYFRSDVVENGLALCTEQSADAICIGEEATLSVTHYLAETFEWSTGETTNSIIITTPGTYSVSVSDGCCNIVEETFEIQSGSGGVLNLEIEGNNVLCEGESNTLTANSNLATSYEWSTGSTDASIDISTPDTYTLTVTDDCGATAVEEIEVIESESIEVNIQGNTEICEGEENTLTVNSNFTASYEWSTGSTDTAIQISEPGVYSVTATDACNSTTSSQIEIIQGENNSINLVLEGDVGCGGQVIASVETNSPNVQWSTGQTGTEITIEDPGNYSVQVENTCGTASEDFTVASSGKIFEMPNAFTPDGDGVNDIFRPIWGCGDVSNFNFKIFNRWGQMVYQSTDPMGGWNGTLNGKPATTDVFVYAISFNISENNRVETAGDVTLLR